MIEFLLELLGEFLLQVLGEALVELGLHSLAEPFRRPPNPWLAALGYGLFGALIGGLSLLIIPHHLISAGFSRIVNLVLTPVAVGVCMACFGAWRARRGDRVLRIDRFSYGYLFALALALVRFTCAA
ncbi:MAG: hypothetical protein H6974_01065 [Gammaproteobacteria bacterium]|nr:hypothetical protein [Gammaproteobacteria bacterium]MCP5195378.1 hypothetical protein [Gammaproteobacteria bacterium]